MARVRFSPGAIILDPVAASVQTIFFVHPITKIKSPLNPSSVQKLLCDLEFRSLHSVEEWVRGGTPSVIALFITKKYNFNYL